MDNFANLSWGNSGGNSLQTPTRVLTPSGSRDGSRPSSARSTPGIDSFSDLVSFGSKNESKKPDMGGMTLQERQVYLQSTKAEEKKTVTNQWGDLDLLMGSSSGLSSASPSASVSSLVDNSDKPEGEDPFAIFNQPPPSTRVPPQASSQTKSSTRAPAKKSSSHGASLLEGFDDISDPEPEMESDYNSREHSHSTTTGDMDSRPLPKENSRDNSRDKAIAELVDMGFTTEQSVEALNHTTNGLNTQQAVEYIMNQAHKRSTTNYTHTTDEESYVDDGDSSAIPKWKSGSPNARQPEITKMAFQFQKQFISKANVFWDMGKKNLVKAIDTYQEKSRATSDGTPAWMKRQDDAVREEVRQRLAQERIEHGDERKRPPLEERLAHKKSEKLASIKSSGGNPMPNHTNSFVASQPPPSQSYERESTVKKSDSLNNVNDTNLLGGNGESVLRSSSNTGSFDNSSKPKEFLTPAQAFKAKAKQKEETTGYVSPSRRRSPVSSRSQTPTASSRPQTPSTPAAKPVVAARQLVPISPEALNMANKCREAGTNSFKLGNFDESLNHYTKALSYIPNKHLLRPLILSNRATCNIKLGDSKAAIADAEQGIMIIGLGLGVGEEAEAGKSLKDIWFKLVSRKAEALEHLEKFKEALSTWNILIHNGFSNKVTLDGKRRCNNALERENGIPSTSTHGSNNPSRSGTPRASNNDTRPSAAGMAAVNKIREQNAEAEKADEERFLLIDLVDNRLNQWKGGKEDNLRALLGSLHTVLWSETGWKQVSMADLIMPKKVKINYMKAVAKTHPDKVSSSTTTEQKMIAQGVFVTLNKAWDDFKLSNNMA